jgi:hypothetical protein
MDGFVQIIAWTRPLNIFSVVKEKISIAHSDRSMINFIRIIIDIVPISKISKTVRQEITE